MICVRHGLGVSLIASSAFAFSSPSWAAPTAGPPLPGSADAGRIQDRAEPKAPAPNVAPSTAPVYPEAPDHAPESSKTINVTIRSVVITGMTAYREAAIKGIYAGYTDKVVTLDTAWKIAKLISDKYHNDGYFLTRVVVPPQEFKDGVLHIRVIEGYIGDVGSDSKLANNRIVRKWLDKIKASRPLNARTLESILLRINDLPGVNLRAVLEPLDGADASGAIRLVLQDRHAPPVSGQISIDAYASRYLGPLEAQGVLQVSLTPTSRTTVTVLSTLTSDEVLFGAIKQEMALAPALTLELSTNHSLAKPGYTLAKFDDVSNSNAYEAALKYEIIRQRQVNLGASLSFQIHDMSTDTIGGATQTRDRIRVLRGGLNFQRADLWNGQTLVNATVSRGLDVLNASPAQTPGALTNYLSRADAKPDFTKVAFDVTRIQTVTNKWTLIMSGSSQFASVPLYSSEQFGYGGQSFGRAYSDSEITGDNGVNLSTELRYLGALPVLPRALMPYGFYDWGRVWNNRDYVADALPRSGSSIGAGVLFRSAIGLSANFGFAFPLTLRQTAPIVGNGKNVRPIFSITYGF